MSEEEEATPEELASLRQRVKDLEEENAALKRQLGIRFTVGMVLGARRERKVMLRRKNKKPGQD